MKGVVVSVLLLGLILAGCNRKPEQPQNYLYKQIVADHPVLDHVVQDIDTGSIYRVGLKGNLIDQLNPDAGKLRGFDLKDSILAWVSDSSSISLLNINTNKQRIIALDSSLKIHHDLVLHYPYLTALYKAKPNKIFKTYTITNESFVTIDLRDNQMKTWSILDFVDDTWLPDSSTYVNAHSNSVEVDEAGNYYVSFRDISQVWKISPDLSTVIYRVGVNSPFKLAGKDFIGQHSVDIVRPDEFFLYDNGSTGKQVVKSRIVRVVVDPQQKTYNVKVILDLPDTLRTIRMGSVQALGDRLSVSVFNRGFHILELDTTGHVHNHLFYEKAHSIKVLPELAKE